MKKTMTVFWAILMIVALAACGIGNDKVNEKTQLGTSAISIVLPEGYAEAGDDFDEDQVAYFYKDDESVDFDVYQWAKGDEWVLEEEAAYFSAEYGTTASAVTVNGVSGMKYISVEEYDGYEYTVVNYMFDDGEYIVELCFWTINTEEELAAVDEIINTIAIDGTLGE